MDISNPQFREQIICIDGETVRPRVRTLAQAAALTPRANVLVHKDDSVDEYYLPRAVIEANGELLSTKILPIGNWNMDNTIFVTVAETIIGINIRGFQAIIRNDADTFRYPIDYIPIDSIMGAELHSTSGSIYWDEANSQWILSRVVIHFFDSVDFDTAVYNRGWIIVQYVN